jgi:hypothetical protein
MNSVPQGGDLKRGSLDELVSARSKEKLVFTTMPHGDKDDTTTTSSAWQTCYIAG